MDASISLSDYFSPDVPAEWDNYDAAERATKIEGRIYKVAVGFAFVALASSMVGFSKSIADHYVTPGGVLGVLVTSVVLPILTGVITKAIAGEKTPRFLMGVSGASLIHVLASGIIAGGYSALPPVTIAAEVLNVLAWSAYFMGANHTRGLSRRRYLELSMDRLKEIMTTNSPKPCNLLGITSKVEGLTHIWVISKDMTNKDILELLEVAHQNKKVLHFTSQIQPVPKHTHYYPVYTAHGVVFQAVQVEMTQDEMANQIRNHKYDKIMKEALFLSVDYLNQCRSKTEGELDANLVNAQLKALSRGWQTKALRIFHVKPNVLLENGIPVVRSQVGELGEAAAAAVQRLSAYYPQAKFDEQTSAFNFDIWQ